MRVGVDIDEVIADSCAAYLPVLNELFGKNLGREDLTRFDFEITYDLSETDMKRFWGHFARTGGWERIAPVEGAAAALARLKVRHEVVIVTGRPEEFVGEKTRRWIAAHAIPHDALVFMGEGDKEEAVRRALDGKGLDALVEDHWGFAEKVAARGVPVYLVDAPWNRAAPPHPKVRRVAGLLEAVEILLAGAAVPA